MGLEGKDLRSANHHQVAGPRRKFAVERLPCVPTERYLGESQGDNGRHQQEQNVAGGDASNAQGGYFTGESRFRGSKGAAGSWVLFNREQDLLNLLNP
jgi:hypothetical protein